MSEAATSRKRLQRQGVALLRRTGLLPIAEHARLQLVKRYNRDSNAAFLAANPSFVAPPDAVMHDAHGSNSYASYLETGKLEAEIISRLVRTHKADAKSILDWGCGPGRVIRHLPELLPGTELFGADYNRDSIRWCSTALPSMHFAAHGLTPPLLFTEKFDVIYGISVLTHLSIEQQKAWVRELARALNPGGILILTTHGEACADALMPEERKRFDTEGVAIRSGVAEGKRCYNAYHHPRYMRDTLFAGLAIREHIAKNPCPHTAQDIWVVANG